jgi:hypothetical protein
MCDSGVGSVAPHQDNTTNMLSLSPGDHDSNALPSTSNRKSNSSVGRSNGRSSASIPLPSTHVARTQSELQLYVDEGVAEQRDTNMFYRLVNGIRERQYSPSRDMMDMGISMDDNISSSERSIAGIYQTRLASHLEVNEHAHCSFDPVETTPKWQMLHREGSTASDEWSISGFDTSSQEQPKTADNVTLHSEKDYEDDEGLFSFEL